VAPKLVAPGQWRLRTANCCIISTLPVALHRSDVTLRIAGRHAGGGAQHSGVRTPERVPATSSQSTRWDGMAYTGFRPVACQCRRYTLPPVPLPQMCSAAELSSAAFASMGLPGLLGPLSTTVQAGDHEGTKAA
jgi:hypothetical protein